MGVKPWDFRSHEGVDRVAMAALRQVGENFSRFLANRAGPYARTKVSAALRTVEQVGWEDFEAQTNGPGLLAAFSMGEGQAFFYVPADLGLGLVDLHLAGPGEGQSRPMSETERQLITPFLAAVAASLADAASSVFGETAAGPVSQVGSGSGLFLSNRRMPCVRLVTKVHVPSAPATGGEVDVCAPVASLRPLLAKLHEVAGAPGPHTAAARAVLKVPVAVALRFPPAQVPLELARNLAPGQVLSLGHLIGQPLLLEVGGKEAFKAVMVEHAKRSACEIVETIATGGPS